MCDVDRVVVELGERIDRLAERLERRRRRADAQRAPGLELGRTLYFDKRLSADQIKTLAIRLSSQRSIQHSEEKLRTILFSGADPELKAEVIKALCKINMDEKEVLDFIDNEHPLVQQAAITGLLQHGKLEDRGITLDYFHTLVHSEDVLLRKNAAIILKELRDPHYKPDIITLLRDPDPGVSFEAYIAAGKTGDEELLQTGVLNGDLKAGSLTVAAGSRMRGRAEFGWDDEKKAGRG